MRSLHETSGQLRKRNLLAQDSDSKIGTLRKQYVRRKFPKSLLHFFHHSGVVQLVAHGPLEPRILVRVQAPEPIFSFANPFAILSQAALTRVLGP